MVEVPAQDYMVLMAVSLVMFSMPLTYVSAAFPEDEHICDFQIGAMPSPVCYIVMLGLSRPRASYSLRDAQSLLFYSIVDASLICQRPPALVVTSGIGERSRKRQQAQFQPPNPGSRSKSCPRRRIIVLPRGKAKLIVTSRSLVKPRGASRGSLLTE